MKSLGLSSKALLSLSTIFISLNTASAISIEDFAVFGAERVIIGGGSDVLSGLVGSYQQVDLAGGGTIFGDIHSGGDVGFNNGTASYGNIFATGEFRQGSSNGRADAGVVGNINAGGDVRVGPGNEIGGSIFHVPGADVQIGIGTTVGGGIFPGVPTPPSLPILPTPTVFASGGADVETGGITLLPGSYGKLEFAVGETLTLVGGNYYFDSWLTKSGLDLTLDFTNGPINLYVTGDTKFSVNNDLTLINGNPEDFYIEGHGEIRVGPGSNFYGIIYAPFNLIHMGSGSGGNSFHTGALWSGTVVDIEHGVQITYSTTTEVPEPSTLLLLALGTLGCGSRFRGRNRTISAD